jgi:ribosome biogenesis protein BMS1
MSEKHRLVHAPMSGGAGGGVVFDGDRLWITTAGSFTRREVDEPVGAPCALLCARCQPRSRTDADAIGEGERVFMDLQDVRKTLGEGQVASDIRLFGGSSNALTVGPLSALQHDDEASSGDDEAAFEGSDDESDLGSDDEGAEIDLDEAPARRAGCREAVGKFGDDATDKDEVAFADSDSELDFGEGDAEGEDDDLALNDDSHGEGFELDDDEADGALRWKADLAGRAARNFGAATVRRHRLTSRGKDWPLVLYWRPSGAWPESLSAALALSLMSDRLWRGSNARRRVRSSLSLASPCP